MKGGGGIERTLWVSSHTLPCSIVFLDPNPQEDDAKFLEFSKRAEGGPSRAGRLQKRFLRYPWNSVHRAAIQNRGKAHRWDSEQSKVGWELGALQSCSLSQDRKILVSVK